MDVARVLLVGRNQMKEVGFANALKKRYQLTLAINGNQAIGIAEKQPPHVIVLDAISMRTTGERICRKLKAELNAIPIIHLHPGPSKEAESVADVLLVVPFTARKLINSIERVAQFSDDETLACGPFSLNVERRVLHAHGQESPLTPRVALLLEFFFRRPGQVIERKTLMEQIWHTAYMGDTRTLDVHIRWIREAIEENPSKPRYLKTIRGVGYRLDIFA